MLNAYKIFSFGWKYIRPYRGRFFLGIFCGFLFALLTGSFVWMTSTLTERFASEKPTTNTTTVVSAPKPSVVPEFFKEWKDAAKRAVDPWLPRLGQPVTKRHVVGLLLFLPLLAVLRGIMDYCNNYCMGWAGERAVRDLRIELMEKLSRLSLDFFTRANTGDLLTRVNTDALYLLQSLRAGAPDLVKESASLVIIFGALMFTDWKLTLALIIILPICAGPLFILGRKARKAAKDSKIINVLQANQLVEFVGGIRVIKAFNLEKEELDRFRKKSAELVHSGMKSVQAREMVAPIIEVVAALGLGLLLLYVFSSGSQGGNPATNLPAVVLGFMLIFQSVRKISSVHVLFEQALFGVERLEEILKEPLKVVDPAAPKPFKEFKGGIKFENVSFGYRDSAVLSGINLEIPRGFKLGIAGESGSGKTTIVNLLFRFYDPTSGSITIDGVDLREITLHDLRHQMALVSQENIIFDQNVAENIARGKPDATRTEIEAAAKSAFAQDFITQLPQGYDSQLGERGASLSVGQKQRICIARAFVRNAPILVLDEATASLDSKAEAEVQADLDRLAEHRTVVCIAHRLSTLSQMDSIIVIKEGRIAEQGTFAELLKAGGAFAELARRQGII